MRFGLTCSRVLGLRAEVSLLSVLDAWGNGLMAELRLKVLASGIVDFTAFSVEASRPSPSVQVRRIQLEPTARKSSNLCLPFVSPASGGWCCCLPGGPWGICMSDLKRFIVRGPWRQHPPLCCQTVKAPPGCVIRIPISKRCRTKGTHKIHTTSQIKSYPKTLGLSAHP